MIWGTFHLPWELIVSPSIEWRNGFPWSSLDVYRDYAGTGNERRFPDYFSPDLQVTKGFRLAGIPLRAGVLVTNFIFRDNPRDVIATAQADNLNLDYAGIRYDALAPQQQEQLLALIETYVGRIRPGHAEVRMNDVGKLLPETYFGWIGEHGEESPFYYRIHSPVILVEFDHLPGIIWDNAEPTRDHIHTIVRTPNGNDYGRDLLRHHDEMHDHPHPHSHHRRGLS